MVTAARRSKSLRQVARRFGVALSTLQRWLERAAGQRLDRVDWSDRPDAPRRTRRTSRRIERRILQIRQQLARSVLGECGAAAIREQLVREQVKPCPCIRTIGRVLERRGALDGRRRVRRPPPPRGWYVAALEARRAELDSFDTIEGLAIFKTSDLCILTGVSLHGGLVFAAPRVHFKSHTVVEALLSHWREVGLPAFAQFDNDNRFVGPKQHRDAIGRVIRLCLSLGITPVFAPPNEMGFQASIEHFNGRWQKRVWIRRTYHSVKQLQQASSAFVNAARERAAARIEAAPARRSIPPRWRFDGQKKLTGMIIYLRRTNDTGEVQLLGRSWPVDLQWTHRLVRVEVDLDQHELRFYALRRREPDDQRLLRTTPYTLPHRPLND
jgi:hypothetical protein